MENRNNTNSVNIDIPEITTKTQFDHDDVHRYLHTNGNNDRSDKLLDNREIHPNVNSTSSPVHHLTTNRRSATSTENVHTRSGRDLESSLNDAEPLLETEMIPKAHPPIAHPELDDDETDSNEIPNTPQNHPGVDDGFFPNDVGPRIGGDDEDPKKGIIPNGNIPDRPSVNSFPYSPGFDPRDQIIPDVNVYQHKKTLAQGMMDLALISANANQLRYVLESYNRHPYYYFSLSFISISLILQIAVGVGLILNSRYDVKKDDHICKADRINNFTVLGIFLVTIVNVFISSFGVADSPTPQNTG